jgi:hypothetical protein
MRAPRLLLLVLALGVALAVAACGSSGSGESAGADVGTVAGADVMPQGTAALVAIDTDAEGEQWQAAEALAQRFPAAG